MRQSSNDYCELPRASCSSSWTLSLSATNPAFADCVGLPRCLVERLDGRLRLVGEPEAADGRAATEVMMQLNNELATMARDEAGCHPGSDHRPGARYRASPSTVW